MQNNITGISISDFLNQLKSENLRFEISDENTRRLMCESLMEMSKFTGWTHIWNHTIRVTGNAIYLAEKENANRDMCFLSAIFHDVYKMDKSDEIGHEIKSAEFAYKILSEFNNEFNNNFKFNNEFISSVVNAIRSHTNGTPQTLEAKILWDADKLDKIGACGIMRRIISKEYTQKQLMRRLKTDMESTIFYLNTSKEIANLRKNYMKKILNSRCVC